jgi:hypothetical protein
MADQTFEEQFITTFLSLCPQCRIALGLGQKAHQVGLNATTDCASCEHIRKHVPTHKRPNPGTGAKVITCNSCTKTYPPHAPGQCPPDAEPLPAKEDTVGN